MRQSRPRTRRSAVGSYRSTSAPCATGTHTLTSSAMRAGCGAVASSTCFEICWAMVHAINLRMMSPTTMPRTPPSSLRRAVTRPIRNLSRTPLPKMCSTDDGPAPRRAERKFLQNSRSNSKGLSGTAVALPDKGSRGTGVAPFRIGELH